VRVPDQRWGITERIKAPSNEEVSEYGIIIKIELVLSMKNYTRAKGERFVPHPLLDCFPGPVNPPIQLVPLLLRRG
jgi:hypothetical protein